MTWDEEFESLLDLPMFDDVQLPAPKRLRQMTGLLSLFWIL